MGNLMGAINGILMGVYAVVLVAMATYSSHSLIIGKEEIDNFFCLIGDILNFFLQKCLLSSPLHFI